MQEMIWRFAHEDEQGNRVVTAPRTFATAAGPTVRILLEEVIEDWADDERGAWTPGDVLDVLVVAPPSMAGRYRLAMSLRAVAVTQVDAG